MIRLLVATLLGGFVLFMWEGMAWMALGLHELDPHPQLKNEGAVVKALEGEKHGIYWIPGSSTQEWDPESDEGKAWTAKHEKGPRGFVVYDPSGAPVMPASTWIVSYLINAGIALALGLVLFLGGAGSFFARFAQAACVGLVVMLAMDVKQGHWMNMPSSWTQGFLLDHLGGYLLLGLVLALIVRPKA